MKSEEVSVIRSDHDATQSAIDEVPAFEPGYQPEQLPKLEVPHLDADVQSLTRQASEEGVRSFIEKPDPAVARAAHASGGLWNSFVMTAQVETLWKLGQECFPEMMRLFKILGEVMAR